MILRLLRGRFTGLTLALLTVSLAASVVPGQRARELLIDVAFSVAFFFAVRSVGKRRRLTTIVLAIPTVVAVWTLRLPATWIHTTIVVAVSGAFLAYLTMAILSEVLRQAAVTADTIVGALCVYFLLGVTWGTAYSLLALINPDAFAVSPALVAVAGWGVPNKPITPLLQYYSFTCLSTLGIGDISPLSPAARVLTALEGIAGQAYLAVLIARLVGIHAARSSR